MCFICGLCAVYTKPGEKAFRVIVETREKIYPYREGANVFVPRDEPGKKIIKDDLGGKGREIVKEVLACAPCAAAHKAKGTGA
jgi:hypothetical protein